MYTCVFVSVCASKRVCTDLCRLRGGLAVHPEEGGNQGVQGERKGGGKWWREKGGGVPLLETSPDLLISSSLVSHVNRAATP